MKNTPTAKRMTHSEPTQKELFTGGKSAEFAVFFNIAFTKLFRTIYYWQEGRIEFDENKLDARYNPLIDQFGAGQIANDLSDEIYSKLRSYIWKGYLTERNSSGYVLEAKDRKMIRQLICKLRALRDFHSHIYHDNAELTFPNELKQFIVDLHNDAMYAFTEKHPEEVSFYQKNLLKHPLFDKESRITQEGRTFFLSLFLTSGEVSRLLQQRRGSKKNDELKFRIKHYIYRYYAHRDGAARKYYNLEEDLHDTLPPEELEELLFARQFYKLNAQVNGIPPFLHDTDLFPLFFKNEQGEHTLCETVQDLTAFCVQQNLGAVFQFEPAFNKQQEEKRGVISIRMRDNANHEFHLNRSDFHRLVLDLIRMEEAEIVSRMQFFLAEREVLLNALAETHPHMHLGMNGETPITLLDYEEYKLRGDRRLKEGFVEWLMAFENRHKKEPDLRKKLLENLRGAPIELRHFDLYQGADQRPRTTDRFLEWCVECLIDFDITPNWYWAFESFQTILKTDLETGKTKHVLRKIIRFFPKKPAEGNFRLCIDSDHILVKVSDQMSDRPFSLGANALRNLMITMIGRKDGHKANSFIQQLLGDLQTELNTIESAIKSGAEFDLSSLKLLDKTTLPEVLLLQLNDAETLGMQMAWKQKTIKRLSYIIDRLETLQSDKTHTSRAKKNEQIMRCYQFFDWDPKFLRQNEYQQLSIFHYSLERITYLEDKMYEAKDRKDKRTARDMEKQLIYYYTLLKDIRRENRNRIPKAVDEVLRKATGLDDLLARTIEFTLELLKKWQNTMHNGSEHHQMEIAQRLKIKQTGITKTTGTFPVHIPFSIHPILVLKAFHAKKGTDLTLFSLSKQIRDNTALTGALRSENYDTASYTALLTQLPANVQKALKKKITGARDRALCQDAILWFIAGRYFERVSPNVRMTLTGHKDQSLPARVGSLRQSMLHIPITLSDGRVVRVQLYFHQLDDTLFVESKDMLTKVVEYIYRRRMEEPDKYKDVADYLLTYGEIVKEMARIQNETAVIARRLLEWEKSIVDSMSEPQIIQNLEGITLRRIGFNKICTHAALPEVDAQSLRELRNHVFHQKIPVTFTFQTKVQNAVIEQYLGKIEFKKDTSQWEI